MKDERTKPIISKGKICYIVEIDRTGKIYLPSDVRKALGADAFVLEVVDGKVVLDPVKR